MTSDQEPTGSRPVEEIEAEIAATRRDLGQTVEALGERLDVKSRVSATVRAAPGRARAGLTRSDGSVRPEAVAALALMGAGVAAIIVWRRRLR
ncbi:hypothetical protein GCM10011519_24630 [Marmoricola endophyticus]|uniref:DUF3618 domain-containing protein n=1 Tax=Marmoricola endophyticus TaxID=2040280 RepID=A0A917F3K8_9ACTN|nr:DUF3618 domain-containing protein [Marmoricola endophyticus]GGF49744.1 hypothetical protein GCM10011519_24630 [Marmoricola endophyticus]